MRKYFFNLIVSLGFSMVYAQEQKIVFPLDHSPEYFLDYKKELTEKYTTYISKFKNDANYKELKYEYEEQLAATILDIEDSLFYSDDLVQNYLEAILAELVLANPNFLNTETYFVLLSRSTAANAYTPGDGTLVINADLIRRLHSESELAFILAHEIGHNYFQHIKKNIEAYVAFYNSESTKQEIKDIKNSEYQKSKKLDEFLKKYTFDKRKHGRVGEFACDSFAIEMLKNTKYNPFAAIEVLTILDSVDSKLFNHEINFETFLKLDSISVEDKWKKDAKTQGFSLSNIKPVEVSVVEKALEDSLKTHPECTERILKAKALLQESEAKNNSPINDSLFQAFKKQLEFESIESEFYFERYDLALYKSFLLLEDFPSEVYPYLSIAKAINGICHNQVTHKFGMVVSQPKSYYPADFNDFLSFLGKQTTEDLGEFSYFFLEQHRQKIQKEKDFYLLLEKAAEYAGKNEKLKQIELQKNNKY